MSRHPTQAEILEQARRAAVGPVKTSGPAWVMAYDRDRQVAQIQMATAYQVHDPETNTLVARVRAPVSCVPVVFVGPTWDLQVGEWGLATFCDRSLDEWKSTGARAYEPADPRRFNITDATFFPGITSPASPLPSSAFAAGAVVLWDRGTGDLRLGDSTAADYVALASLVSAQLDALKTAINSWTPVATDGGAALKVILTALFGAGWPSSVAATKTKAK